MNDFLQDYRELNRYLFLENYQIKNNQQLIFLSLPPVETHYPNQERIFLCEETLKELKEKESRRRFSFSLETPTKEQNRFHIFGHSPIFHDDPDYIQDIGEEKTVTVNWIEYSGVEKEEENEGEEADDVPKAKGKNPKSKEKEEVEVKYTSREEADRSAAILQKYIKRMRARAVLKNLKKRSYKRMNVCRELVKTEKDYVNNLKVLRSVYIEPFKKISEVKSRPVITPQDFGQVFAGLESIIKLNEGLAICLERCIFDRSGDYDTFALLSKEILAIAPFIMMYRTYCAKYERTLGRLKMMRKDRRFAEILEKMDRDPNTTKLGLPSYLILPIQRVPRYKLLLRDIIRCTDPEHPDSTGLEEAYQKIEETADHLNRAMKEIEESEKVLRLSKRFLMGNRNFVIHQPHRRFVREGVLYKAKNKKQPRHVHLFNDVFVISVRNQRSGMFEFKTFVEMKNLSINYSNDLGHRKCLKLSNEVFFCRSPEDRTRWLKSIFDCRNEYHQHRGAERGPVSGPTKASLRGAPQGILVKEEEFELTIDQCIKNQKNTLMPTIMLKMVSKASIFKKNKPHQRKFVISEDEKLVQWGSPKKKLSESGIPILNIKELVVGQTTLTFKRSPIPSAAGLSFSLLYGDGGFDKNGDWQGKTLDLIALNRKDFEVWTRGLKFLIQDKGRTTHTRRKVGSKERGVSLQASLALNVNVEKDNFEKRYADMGDIYTWGRGAHGALGHGSERSSKIPRVVMILLPYDVKKVFCGKRCCSSLLTNGNVLTWGHNECCRLGHKQEANFLSPQPVVKLEDRRIQDVSHGDLITLFLGENGAVWGCGDNSNGFLGQVKEKKVAEPNLILSENLGFRKIIYIEAGSNHFGCIDEEGVLYTWGKGEFGQLGHGKKEDEEKPKVVEALKGIVIKQVALGNWHSMVLTEDGKVFSFGDGSFGQLGIPPPNTNQNNKEEKIESSIPKRIEFFGDGITITQISTGQSHSGAIDSVGNCYLWGAGNYGQLGNGNTRKVNHTPLLVKHYIAASRSIVKLLPPQHKFIKVVCGANHCIALMEELHHETTKQVVLSWGAGTYGRLGFKSEKDVYIPTELPFFKNKIVRNVAAKGQMSATVNAHQWIPDSDVPCCMQCEKPFTFRRRRHHCRNCGGIFCSRDSAKKIMILQFGMGDDVRVCNNCHSILTKKYKKN